MSIRDGFDTGWVCVCRFVSELGSSVNAEVFRVGSSQPDSPPPATNTEQKLEGVGFRSGPWSRSIKLAMRSDHRQQPWISALETERLAKTTNEYDNLPDRSKESWEDGSGDQLEAIRMCNH